MGELVAIAMVVIVAILAVGLIVWGRQRQQRGITADNSGSIAVHTVTIPRREQGTVLRELAPLLEKRKPGVVEFYETDHRLIRIIVE